MEKVFLPSFHVPVSHLLPCVDVECSILSTHKLPLLPLTDLLCKHSSLPPHYLLPPPSCLHPHPFHHSSFHLPVRQFALLFTAAKLFSSPLPPPSRPPPSLPSAHPPSSLSPLPTLGQTNSQPNSPPETHLSFFSLSPAPHMDSVNSVGNAKVQIC